MVDRTRYEKSPTRHVDKRGGWTMHFGTGGYEMGWGTLMLINVNIAQTKHRNGLTWFFISLFIGPIATLLLAVMNTP